MSEGCLLLFSLTGAEQPGQPWLAACSPALPFHSQDTMSKKKDKCVLCPFLQHSKPVWELVVNSALLGPVFEFLVEKECSNLHLIFVRLSSGDAVRPKVCLISKTCSAWYLISFLPN